MAKLSFSTKVDSWVERIPEAAEAVFKESTKEVVKEMQTLTTEGGRMRFDTGFLQASLLASTTAMPRIQSSALPVEGQSYAWSFSEVEGVIASATLSDTLYFGYTASYAAYREYGTRGQPPDAFVRSAAQNWDVIVARSASKAKKAFGL
ncbi:MAG: HK97 gp10 family phage protein [Agrobacterium cavarae]